MVAYDHRGHGQSGWNKAGQDYLLQQFADDQMEVVRQLNHKPIVVGASLGGLSAMVVEGEIQADTYEAIVFVDITPQMDQTGAMDVIRFMAESLKEGFATLDDVSEQIAQYTGRPKRHNNEGLIKNLRIGDDGRYYWHWDPNLLTIAEDFSSGPERLCKACLTIKQPLMLVRGMESNVVTEAVANEFLEMMPHTKYVDVKGAKHMVAGDKNDVFTEAVRDFICKL